MSEETKVEFDFERFKQLVAHFDNGNQNERGNAFRAVMMMCEKDGRCFWEIAKDAYGSDVERIAELEAQIEADEAASREFELRAEEISHENAELRNENERLRNAERSNAGNDDDEKPAVKPNKTDDRRTLLIYGMAAMLIVAFVGGFIQAPKRRSSERNTGAQNTVSREDGGSTVSKTASPHHKRKNASSRILEAANAGNPKAMFMVGAGYKYGEDGFPEDDAEAAKWFRKAADAGNAQGMANLGFMYEWGDGVPKDIPQAILLYIRAIAIAKNSDDLGAALARDRLKALEASLQKGGIPQ